MSFGRSFICELATPPRRMTFSFTFRNMPPGADAHLYAPMHDTRYRRFAFIIGREATPPEDRRHRRRLADERWRESTR